MNKIKRACWNCQKTYTCDKKKKGNYHCKEHKFIFRVALINK